MQELIVLKALKDQRIKEVATFAVTRLHSSFYHHTSSVNHSASSKRPMYFRAPSGMLYIKS